MILAEIFCILIYLLIDWFNNILVNLIGEPYLIYIIGLVPRHFNGMIIGIGLFLIIIIT
jgi:hypothetical protein